MKRESIVMGTLVLSGSAIFVRMIGFVFRIYLSNIMGAEGIGVYTLIMSLFGLCATVATSGISGAVGKLAAEELARGKAGNARRVLWRSVQLSLVLSLTVGAVLLLFAQPIGTQVLRDGRTVLALRFLAPGMPLMAVSSCIRGYFVAARKVGNPAVGQVLEQLVKMAFIMGLIGYWMPRGVEYGCALVVLGMTVGEVVCFLFSLLGYLWERRGASRERSDQIGVMRRILGFAVPVSASSYARSALRLLEDVLILSGLRKFSGQEDLATGEYGVLKGMVMPLLIFPLSLLSAFVVMLTPEISRLHSAGNQSRLEYAITTILRYTSIVGVFIVCIFMTFSYELGMVFYHDEQVGEMLRLLSWLCPFMCLEMVVVSILQGLGEQVSSLRYSVTDSLLRIALVYLLLPRWGVHGFVVMVVISNLYTSVLNLRRLLKIAHISFKINDWVLKPTLAALAAGQGVKLVCNAYLYQQLAVWQALAVGITLGAAVFVGVLFSVGSISLRDLSWIARRLRRPEKAPAAELETAV